MTFVKVLEATTILACFENFLKSRLIFIAKSVYNIKIITSMRADFHLISIK